MPKLVIKQQLPPPSAQEKFARALQNILPGLLLVIGAATAASLYLNREPETTPVVEALNVQLPLVYTRQQERLQQLSKDFDQLSGTTEGYDKHQQLVTFSEGVMQQLSEMDRIVNDLSLPDADKQALLSRHQYQKDYWESKLVFHRLRLARFKVNNPDTTQDALREAVGSALDARQAETAAQAEPAVTESAIIQPEKPAVVTTGVQESAPVANTQPASAKQPLPEEQAGQASPPDAHPAAAQEGLPPGVELPPGMCPLFGPGAAACKPGAEDK